MRVSLRKNWIFHILPAQFVAFGLAAQAQTELSILRGREVAQRACADCHAMDGAQGGTIQGMEVPSFSAIAGQNWSAERLQAFIMTPHRPMPATPLPLSEVRDLADYIVSLNDLNVWNFAAQRSDSSGLARAD
jgi:mono/diheme cytochrome c family protein